MKIKIFKALLVVLFSLSFIGTVNAEESNRRKECLQKAIKRVEEIRLLPEKKYINTLDGQQIILEEFFMCCSKKWPHCVLFHKFYYWESEIKTINSKCATGIKRHKVRMYWNCLSTFCPSRVNPEKTHGDVVEYYDEQGIFMGLSVYVGMGKYCSLPFSGYKGIQ